MARPQPERGFSGIVVLSACETDLGRARSDVSLLGLRRAFERAGAKTVIRLPWSSSSRLRG